MRSILNGMGYHGGLAEQCAAWEERNRVPADEAVVRSVELRQPVISSIPTSEAAKALTRVSEWPSLDLARTSSAFYERALRALR